MNVYFFKERPRESSLVQYYVTKSDVSPDRGDDFHKVRLRLNN